MLLFALGAMVESSTTIPFANGREYTVSVYREQSGLDWGMAYLSGHGMIKPISDVLASSRIVKPVPPVSSRRRFAASMIRLLRPCFASSRRDNCRLLIPDEMHEQAVEQCR